MRGIGTEARVFIAWSRETRPAAELLRERLAAAGVAAWLSDQIELGTPFRSKIRKAIRRADLVVAIFPPTPSRWQIAEAGLAYFEQKLLPVVMGAGDDDAQVIDPFADLQIHRITREDVQRRHGETIDQLVLTIKEKLGEGPSATPFVRLLRVANRVFLWGLPVTGFALISLLIVSGLILGDETVDGDLLIAAHTVWGAIVYGGGAFLVSVFARTGLSRSYAERQFGFRMARQLFAIWLFVAIVQLALGLGLLSRSSYSFADDTWIPLAIISYLFAVIFLGAAYDRYRSWNDADRDQEPVRTRAIRTFTGNLLFVIGLLLLTAVLVLMSTKKVSW